jgi:RHS repeat-associated protein
MSRTKHECYVDEVLTMDRGGQTYYYHQNALWSVEAITDATGIVVERDAYDAYGSPTTLSSAIGNPYLFTGRELNQETGIYYHRARYYDPAKGRFLQREPIQYVTTTNLYLYADNRPTTLVDPSGEQVEEEIYKLDLSPVVQDVNNLPEYLDVPMKRFGLPYVSTIGNVKNKAQWKGCSNETSAGLHIFTHAIETKDGTENYFIYVFTKDITSEPTAVPMSKGLWLASKSFTRIGVYYSKCYDMYDVTFRIYDCCTTFNTFHFRVVENINLMKKDLCLPTKYRYSDYPGSVTIDAAKVAEAAKALLVK